MPEWITSWITVVWEGVKHTAAQRVMADIVSDGLWGILSLALGVFFAGESLRRGRKCKWKDEEDTYIVMVVIGLAVMFLLVAFIELGTALHTSIAFDYKTLEYLRRLIR